MVIRIVFFGTPDFAVPVFEALADAGHELVSAVTQPDRPRGRGQHVTESSIKRAAAARGVPVLQPVRLGDPAFLDALRHLAPDMGVVAAYGKILPESVLSVPRLGLLNVHASLLPRYRGAAPVHRAVIAGEQETGVTIMRVVRELDAGPMLARAARPIGPRETSEDVERALAGLGARLLVDTVAAVAAGTAVETEQDHRQATYAPRLTRDDGIINWNAAATAVHNLVRGLHPWPHAFTFLRGVRHVILATEPPGSPEQTVSEAPGTILEAAGDSLRVSTGDGTLRILELQLEGRRALPVREFLAGHRLAAGDRFTAVATG